MNMYRKELYATVTRKVCDASRFEVRSERVLFGGAVPHVSQALSTSLPQPHYENLAID